MADQFIMALGLDYAVADKHQASTKELAAKERPSVETALRASNLPLAVSEIEKNKAAVTFDGYGDAEELIKHLYNYCSAFNTRLTEEDKLNIDIILMLAGANREIIFARAVNLLTTIMEARDLSSKDAVQVSSKHAVQVYITKDIYHKLEPRHQDLYRSAIEVAGTTVHKRFSDEVQRCFVISAIGDPDSAFRKRADLVFEKYIKPACEATPFRPVRGEMMRGSSVMSDLTEALQSDPMVIVYLGPPKLGYNPNVMFEFGGRYLVGGPYILIKDETSEGKGYTLPFDVQDTRVVDIPEQEEVSLEVVTEKRNTITQRILASIKEEEWDYVHPRATVDIKIGDPAGGSKFTWASKSMETLFDLTGLVGKALKPVIGRLLDKMPACQRQPFVDEQDALVMRLVVPMLGDVRNVRATIPIVFKTHPMYSARAFLPIINSYSFTGITNTLRLRLIYIDVTSVTKFNKERGCYMSNLSTNGKIDLSEQS